MAQAEAVPRRKILVAVDEGDESLYALSWCLTNLVSHHSKDTLILLYVKSPPAVYSAMDGTGYLFSSEIVAAMERYNQQVSDSVMEKAERLCAGFDQVVVEKRVESGDARDVICQTTQKLGVDLLVMGSHGYGMIKRAFLGSVSNHCAQNVKCPVMIVKRPKSTT
ncbi:hypothetical protein MLD38_016459 [Melastoma candidum]|uniref:Uncharacterized protein n=1 Tax=Melastoma candidum TaxID=119954 RepID=A0ACB9QRI4_9MYRT|nr:hypothetical protein MLD38_016459 [Melastoma candidum]